MYTFRGLVELVVHLFAALLFGLALIMGCLEWIWKHLIVGAFFVAEIAVTVFFVLPQIEHGPEAFLAPAVVAIIFGFLFWSQDDSFVPNFGGLMLLVIGWIVALLALSDLLELQMEFWYWPAFIITWFLALTVCILMGNFVREKKISKNSEGERR